MLKKVAFSGAVRMSAKSGESKASKSHPALETIKSRVLERVESANLSRNEASRRAGLGLSYVNDLLAGKTKNPSRESLAKLGTVVDTDVEYFLGTQDSPRNHNKSEATVRLVASAEKTVPLFYVGLPDADGFFTLDESMKTAIPMPFSTASDSYCVSVPDDTMAPRYRAGEVVVVNPRRPASHGGFAVIKQTDGRVAIREIITIETDKVSVKALKGGPAVAIPRQQIQSLDRIIGTCEVG